MKMTKTLIIAMIIVVTNIYSQSDQTYRKYLTQLQNAELNNIEPDFKNRKAKLEEYVSSYTGSSSTPIEITVFVHVLYKEADPPFKGEDIRKQLKTVNDIFQGVNYINRDSVNIHQLTFLHLMANVNLQFCLPESNVFYKKIDTDFSNNWWQVMNAQSGGSDLINPDQQINIYIIDMGENVAGFAKYPWTITPDNGIILNSLFLEGKHPSPKYQSGKTLAHLMASYLGLHDLWDEYQPCQDDYVEDTPSHFGPSSDFLSTTVNAISFCDHKGSKAMTINFMDNTEDKGLHLFTEGQSKRIRAMLSEEGPLYSLTSGPCGQATASSRTDGKEWIKVVPNPTNADFALNYFSKVDGKIQVQIMNTSGVIVHNDYPYVRKGQNEMPYKHHQFAKGFYIIKITGAGQESIYTNLIIN